MFPIPWNFPFRKKDGSLGKMEDLGGSYTLPTASNNTKGGVKVGSGLTMQGEVLNNANPTPYTLPVATNEILGGIKVGSGLSINDGVLSAAGGTGGKIYYKGYSQISASTFKIAAISGDVTSDSGIHFGTFTSNRNITVNGYTPICAVAYSNYSGNSYAVGIERDGMSENYSLSFIIGNYGIANGNLTIRVYYVKNEDLEHLT